MSEFDRTHLAAEISEKYGGLKPDESSGDAARVAGRVMSMRRLGGITFAVLQDVTGQIQLLAEQLDLDFNMGDWIGAWGEIVKSRRGELSVKLEGFQLLNKSHRPWPDKFHGLRDVERRYRQRYLDLATNPQAREFAIDRAKATSAIRTWLENKGYIEVETPILQPIYGGANAKPFVTFHEELETNLYLRIAPELYLKRLVIGGIEKVFEVGRVFRNESVSFKYNPEFTMLEAYEAFADYNDMADLIEGMVRHIAEVVGSKLDLSEPFRRARLIDLVAEAGINVEGDLVAECERAGVPYDPAWSWGKLLQELYEKKVETNLSKPIFVMDYPVEVSPLARKHRSDDRFAEKLDLIVNGVELGTAYSELIDPVDQRARFDAQAAMHEAGDEEAHLVDEDFLLALEYGLPPTGGLGMGVDRTVMVLTEAPSIREVILFPALRPESGSPPGETFS